MTDDNKTETETTTETETETKPPATETKPPASGDTGGDSDFDKKVKAAVAEALKELRPTGARVSRTDMEAEAQRLVEEAQQRFKKDEAERQRLDDIEAKVKEVTEKAPVKVRKLTKVFWGDDNSKGSK